MTHEEYRRLAIRDIDYAQKKLFEEYFSYVYAIVYNRLRENAAKEDIEECISDVFADVYSCYDHENQLTGDIKAFIGTIAKRRSIGYFNRSTARNLRTVSIDEEDIMELPSEEDVSENAEKKEMGKILLSHVESLGEPDSTIIMEKYYFGMKSAEIGKILSMSPSAVRVRCGRALKKLKKILKEADFGGEYFYEKQS